MTHAVNLLCRLPSELLSIIYTHLRTIDLKQVRLTCRLLQHVSLRLGRVFLSTNPRDIEVFIAITQHEAFRGEVVEIIYDDARLPGTEEDPGWGAFGHEPPPRGVPFQYNRMYEELMEDLSHLQEYSPRRLGRNTREEKLRARMSVQESYAIFDRLRREQQEVVSAGLDAEALRLGIQCFPNLRTITITPATHGRHLRPLYETPMIRDLPHSLIYPVPRGWPEPDSNASVLVLQPWMGTEMDKWRGFRVVASVLAHMPSNVTSLIMDTNHLPSGLSCRMFDQPNDDYNHFTSILGRPGFSRLDLALTVGGQHNDDWPCSFRTDLLRRALAKVQELTRFSFSTNVNPSDFGVSYENDGSSDLWIPLRTFLPVTEWPNLRHFGLSRFMVTQSDLLALLHVLPSTLRSIELSYLYFKSTEGGFGNLLVDMRDHLGWRERIPGERPRITVNVDEYGRGQTDGYPVDISHEVENFMYRDGKNPFDMPCELPDGRVRLVGCGMGVGIEWDPFEPEHRWPHMLEHDLQRLGYIEKDDEYFKHEKWLADNGLGPDGLKLR